MKKIFLTLIVAIFIISGLFITRIYAEETEKEETSAAVTKPLVKPETGLTREEELAIIEARKKVYETKFKKSLPRTGLEDNKEIKPILIVGATSIVGIIALIAVSKIHNKED